MRDINSMITLPSIASSILLASSYRSLVSSRGSLDSSTKLLGSSCSSYTLLETSSRLEEPREYASIQRLPAETYWVLKSLGSILASKAYLPRLVKSNYKTP